MKRLLSLAVAAALILVAINGCDQNRNPVGELSGQGTIYLVIPSGGSVTSATLYLYCASPSMQTVYVHRATSGWDAGTVTWNSFGEAFDTAVAGSFDASASGWQSVDITALVKGWIDSSYTNFGLVLDQDVIVYPRAAFFSNEGVMNKPYLEVHYTVNGSDSTQVFATAADAVLSSYAADANDHTSGLLLTGYAADGYEYQSLVRFDVPVIPPPPSPPPDTTVVTDSSNVNDSSIVLPDSTFVLSDGGCTRPARWWAHNSGCGPFARGDSVSGYLPIWLGDVGGQFSILVFDACDASKYLQPRHANDPLDPVSGLYAELLAAKLNIARGADDADVAETIDAADAFIAGHTVSTRRWWTQQNDFDQVREWTRTLQLYNEGVIGPGRCHDQTTADFNP